MSFRKLLAMTVAACAATSSAYASPVLRLSDGTTTINCSDGSACDLNPVSGVVTFIGAIGNFSINVSTGLGESATPTNLIDLNSLNVSSGAGTLTISLSDTGYNHIGVIVGSWGGTLSGAGSVTAAAYAGTGNALFQESMLLGALGPFGAGAFSGGFTALGPASGPYSLTEVVTIRATGPLSYSGDFELKVPEPSALALAGVALLALGVAGRRRRA